MSRVQQNFQSYQDITSYHLKLREEIDHRNKPKKEPQEIQMLEFIAHRLQSNYDWYVEDIRCLSSRCRKLETLNKNPILELWIQWLSLIPQYMSLIGCYIWLKRGLVNWKIDEKKYRLIQKAWKVEKLRKKIMRQWKSFINILVELKKRTGQKKYLKDDVIKFYKKLKIRTHKFKDYNQNRINTKRIIPWHA